MLRRSSVLHSAAAAGYALLACVLTWPLSLHLSSALLDDIAGDAGVYVWNLWIFSHELVRHAHVPFTTNHVLAYTGGANLTLHNYAPVAGLAAWPLLEPFGLIAAYNIVLLLALTLSGWGVFVLARRLGLDAAPAWSAGALFVASPVMSARSAGHFSLVIAAALPLFLWALLKTIDTRRLRDAVLIGVIVAIAQYSDAYYAIYCAMMGAVVLAARFIRLEWRRRNAQQTRLTRLLNGTIGVIGLAIAWRVLSGTTAIEIGPIRIGLQTLYTPVLALSCLVVLRAWLTWKPVMTVDDPTASLRRLVLLGVVSVGVCLLLWLPALVGIERALVDDQLFATETYWRSSPRGVDLLAYLVPNPSHAWFGSSTREWFRAGQENWYPEYIASFSLVAFGLIAWAAGRRVLPPLWVGFTAFFVWLSLGPFIHVAGANTYVPGLWAFLRYAPLISFARSPSRFAIVAVIGMSLLFAFAVQALRRRDGGKWLAGILAVGLAIEVIPAPRQLHSVAVPPLYDLVQTTNDESGRLLDLPVGIHDGTSNIGHFDAATLYYQTFHWRPIFGAYLSRVPERVKNEHLNNPVFRALFELSENHDLNEDLADEAHASRDEFLRQACIRFVMVNKKLASNRLREFAVETLGLDLVREDDGYALFTLANPVDCSRSAGGLLP